MEFASVRCLRVSPSWNQLRLKIQGFLSATIVVYIFKPQTDKNPGLLSGIGRGNHFIFPFLLHSELRPNWSCIPIFLFCGVSVSPLHAVQALSFRILDLVGLCFDLWLIWTSGFVSPAWGRLTPTPDDSFGFVLSGHSEAQGMTSLTSQICHVFKIVFIFYLELLGVLWN